MICGRYIALMLVFHLPALTYLNAQSSAEQDSQLFENSIRPVLVARCISCHGPTKSESGLRLDRKQSLLTGGDSGSVVIPGDVDGSLLVQVVDYQHDIKMPPEKALSEIDIQNFRQWIAQGAYWPDEMKLGDGPELRSGPATDAERAFWAFQPLQDSQPPAIEANSINNDIDRFVQSKLRELSLSSNEPADKRSLIRRITFDLTGLPPSQEATEHFLNDTSTGAVERLVDGLLQSQDYGERWGRHWLDVVRYSDTAGETADYPIPDAWRYRNYVIDAFNKDKPYDQFLREQIAGDIYAYANPELENFSELVTATGFIAIARRFGFDSENYHHLTIQDTIDTVGQATLGLSIGCARCHDHKFDPLSMEDYYALFGIFESTLYPLAGSEQKQKVRSLVPLHADLSVPSVAAEQNRILAAKQRTLQKLGRNPSGATLRSLTDQDFDFELQSPAAGGSRGVLVAPWLYDGPISVTNSAQSPFIDKFPKGKVGVLFPSGRSVAGIWQALNHRSFNPSDQQLTISFDFRIGKTQPDAAPSADKAVDLATPAKNINPASHHGLSLDFCGQDRPAELSVLIGSSKIEWLWAGQQVELASALSNNWYHLTLTTNPASGSVQGVLKEHDGNEVRIERPIPKLSHVTLDTLRIQTSQLTDEMLPPFELDNLAVIPGKPTVQQANSPTTAASLATNPGTEQSELGEIDSTKLQAELKAIVGMDGDFELQTNDRPPVEPWNPGPNSVVKCAARSQSPFQNFYPAGQLGIHLPNRGEYDGFGLQLDKIQPNEAGHLTISFDFRCASQDAGGSGSWRYYLGHGPGNSAAIELFFNGTHFVCRSADARESVSEIQIDTWYQVQLDADWKSKTYSGKLISTAAEIAFKGQLATNWDGTIDYTFVDSYGHISGVRPALDVDNFSLGQQSRESVSSAFETKPRESELQNLVERRAQVQALRNKLESLRLAAENLERQLLEPPQQMGYAIAEGTPHDSPIQLRGEPSQPGKLVNRRMPQLFTSSNNKNVDTPNRLRGSGRLDLANWITGEASPLAARVMVNRIWQQHFGRGLVRTENDFGTRGELPTHPELLDWLSVRFVESGWSIKYLHRLIIASATYQQSTRLNEKLMEVDPENRWLWRYSPRRLSAEEIRDAMLLVSGMLDASMGQEHPFPASHTWSFTQHAPFYAVYETNRRSIYLMQQRIKRHPFLALFDGADPNVSTARREATIVPTQALFLMNNPWVHQVAARIAEPYAANDWSTATIDSLYEQCLGRNATEEEIQRATKFLQQYFEAEVASQSAKGTERQSAWAALVRTLVTRNEFLFVD